MIGIPVVLVLCLVFYQDLKQRAIHLFVFVALVCAEFATKYLKGEQLLSVDILLNCSYMLVLITILLLYFRLRFGSWNLLEKGLGLGDLVFWIVIGLYLEFELFILWFNASITLALIVHFIFRRFRWYGNADKVPLAGLQAIPLIFLILWKI